MCRETVLLDMAAKQQSTFGMRHVTVVPSNLDPTDETDEETEEESAEADA